MFTHYYSHVRFALLLSSVFICGFAEGMLLPLISSVLEQRGMSALTNGMGTTALYIGMLICVPFMEKPIQQTGYKPFLFVGLLLITVSLFLFPIAVNLWWWFLLRFFIGIGDSMLHFAAQTWIVISSPEKKRGRHIACYGLSFGLGFAAGPPLVGLLTYGLWVPFTIAGSSCLIVCLLLLLLKNEQPSAPAKGRQRHTMQWPARYRAAIAAVWSGLVSTFSYGFIDASLNNSFPIFALRSGYSVDDVAFVLPAFVGGALLTQLPLGVLGDHMGRQRMMPLLTTGSAALFLLAGCFYHSFAVLFVTLLVSGMLIGSLYSMSMGYVSDMLETPLLPLGNILLSFFYSIGCILGPLSGGFTISRHPDGRLFFSLSFMLLLISASILIHQFCRRRSSYAAGVRRHRMAR
ncbi:MAG: MFS transporter [Sporolactobacillus sp.]